AAQRVQERGVHRIHAVVLQLEPVAGQRELRRRHQPVARYVVAVVGGKRGPPLRRPQVSEHQSGELVRRIGSLPDPLAKAAPRRLTRCFQAPAVDVVDPAVIATADAALEGNAELERRPAMGAVQVQHAHAPAAIPEDDQVLAENAYAERSHSEIPRERHRLPESPEVLPAWSPGAHLRELAVRRGDVTTVVAVEPDGLQPGDARSSPLHGTSCLAATRAPVKRMPPGTLDLVRSTTVVSSKSCRREPDFIP